MPVHVEHPSATAPPSRAVQALAALALGVAWFGGILAAAALLLMP